MKDRLAGLRSLLQPVSSEAYARLVESARRKSEEVPDATLSDLKCADELRLGEKVNVEVFNKPSRKRSAKKAFREKRVVFNPKITYREIVGSQSEAQPVSISNGKVELRGEGSKMFTISQPKIVYKL